MQRAGFRQRFQPRGPRGGLPGPCWMCVFSIKLQASPVPGRDDLKVAIAPAQLVHESRWRSERAAASSSRTMAMLTLLERGTPC